MFLGHLAVTVVNLVFLGHLSVTVVSCGVLRTSVRYCYQFWCFFTTFLERRACCCYFYRSLVLDRLSLFASPAFVHVLEQIRGNVLAYTTKHQEVCISLDLFCFVNLTGSCSLIPLST